NLSSVTIPESIQLIEDYVFPECTKLAVVYGVANSYAKTWADSKKLQFIPIGFVGAVLNKDEISLPVNGSETLTAHVCPDTAEQSVTWSSSADAIATVSASGVVTAHQSGTAIITAKPKAGDSATCTVHVGVLPTSVSLDKTSIELQAGTTEKLTAKVLPTDATDNTVTWHLSGDSSVATVSADGVVTALKSGWVTVQAQTVNGLTATAHVTVYDGVYQPAGVSYGLKYNHTANGVTIVGYTGTAMGQLSIPETIDGKAVTVIADNVFSACYGFTGELVLPRALVSIGRGAFSNCTGLSGHLEIPSGVTEIADYTFDRCDITSVHIPKTVARIANSAFGSYQIALQFVCGATGSAAEQWANTQKIVFVADDFVGVVLNKETLAMQIDAEETLTASVFPLNVADKTVTWASGNAEMVGVTQKGVVTALKEGSTTITATNNGKTAVCNVTVTVGVTGLRVEPTTLTVMEGKTAQLTARVIPQNATNKDVTWQSYTPQIATVSNSGVVTGVAVGSATIAATTVNGIISRCTVTVVPAYDDVFTPTGAAYQLQYKNNTDGTLSIVGCAGNTTGELKLPETIFEKTVTHIGDSAFSGCSGFTGDLVIPNTVTSIAANAFSRCSGFTGDLVIPNTVTSIGSYAFSGCSGLTGSLKLPANFTTIEYGVFSGCGFTGKLTLPASLKSIAMSAFEGCSGITGNLEIPAGVTDLTYMTFQDCTGISSLTLAPEMKNISGSFMGCTALKTVFGTAGTYAETWAKAAGYTFVTGAFNGVTLNKASTVIAPGKTEKLLATHAAGNALTWTSDNEAFATVTADGTVKAIKDGVANITATPQVGLSATCQVTVKVAVEKIELNKTAITLQQGNTEQLVATVTPASATDKKVTWYVGFYPATSDSTVSVSQDGTVTAIKEGTAEVFARTENGKEAKCVVTVTPIPYKTYKPYPEAEYELQYVENKDGSVSIIGYKGWAAGRLVIPPAITEKPITSIGDKAFSGCSELTGRLVLPDSITSIGKQAFFGTGALKGNAVLPKGLVSIGEDAFCCSGVTWDDLVIPDSVTSVGANAFSGTTLIGKLKISKNMTEITECAFFGSQYGSQKPISVFIPANIQKIAPAAFNKGILKTIYGENDTGAAAVWAK
ncbi:MAG: leucine-rich repeat protein, partial [Ruthenibacterium sp.]